MLGYTLTEFIAGMILLFMALVSLVSTVTTLWLIYDMKRRNGYLLLIFNLTISQFFYDLAFFLLPFYTNPICLDIVTFMCTFAGLAVTLWTNVISLVLYNIVKYLRSFDIYSYYYVFAAVIFVPSSVLASLVVAYYGQEPQFEIFNQVYYWTRIGSILFNVVIHGMISYKLSRMGFAETGVAAHDDPVRVLASRIKYYPIIQILSRAGAAWYEFRYGFDTDSYSQDMSLTQRVALYFYAICVPTAGIGYFLVFLVVQPAAYHHLKGKLRSLCSSCCCVSAKDEEDGLFRDDTIVSVNLTGSLHRRGSQPLLGGGAQLHYLSDMDEDELSQQIDQRYFTHSADSVNSNGGSSGVFSFMSRGSAASKAPTDPSRTKPHGTL